jgi:hypothetical protein
VIVSVIDQRIVSLPLVVSVNLVLLGLAPCGTLRGDDSQSTELASRQETDSWKADGWPLMKTFCLDCHNADVQEAELDLSGFDSLAAMDGGDGAMRRVLEMVRFGAMPPEDADLPSNLQRKQLVDSLETTLYSVSCDLRPRPGKVTARRLNRSEYNHSIRDLFGVDLRPADAFPSDEVGAGFDNNGDVLSLSPMLIEKYMTAAEQVAARVLVDPASLPRINDSRPGDQLLIVGDVKTGSFYGRFLARDAFAWADFQLPASGEYRLRVDGGNAVKESEPTVVAVFDQSGILLGTHDFGYYGGSGGSKSFELRLTLAKGKHRFFVEPIEDTRDLLPGKTRSPALANLDPDVIERARQKQQQVLKPDRAFDRSQFPFMIRRVSIEGPQTPPEDLLPPSQKQILRKMASQQRDEWVGVSEAATACLQPLMRRAFREPVSKDEAKPYAELVIQATERGESYYEGLQVAISAVLMSPRFLFRVETPPDGYEHQPDIDVPLTPHQLATRLSYFLWSSLPDEKLLDDADRDRLDEKRLANHVQRMIADEKADTLATEFAAQWLGLRNLQQHEVDSDRFAGFDQPLQQAMSRETEQLFMHLVRENRPIAELLTADYSYLNERLAKHYGMDGVQGDHFRRVSLKETPRRGILSHASVLTLTSNPARTSPVKRGKWVLENVLGTPPPEPPAGVPELEQTKAASADASLREQLEVHRADPSCAACHKVMDQLGFGLEQFDAIGRFRQPDSGPPIDASGELPGGRVFNGAAELARVLGRSERDAFARTATERLLTFALGRELSPADRCVVDGIVQRTAENDHRIVDLVWEVVQSRPFQYYEMP